MRAAGPCASAPGAAQAAAEAGCPDADGGGSLGGSGGGGGGGMAAVMAPQPGKATSLALWPNCDHGTEGNLY